jgi:hypothetical protein
MPALEQKPALQQHGGDNHPCAHTCTPCNTFKLLVIVPLYWALSLCDAVGVAIGSRHPAI